MRDVDLNVPMAESRALLEQARRFAPGGVQGDGRWYEPQPLFIKRARGSRIWDVDGNEFIDYWGAAGPAILGHDDPSVGRAVVDALHDDGVQFTAPHPREVELAEALTALIPCAEMVSICGGGGSDAVYNAVRLARAATGREKLLKFEGGYHGWHDYLAASIKPSPEEAGPANAPHTVPASKGSLACALDKIVVASFNDVEALEEIVAREAQDLAAIVIEPVCHSLGCLIVERPFLERIRELCDHHGIVLIFDEIITGFRHSLGGAQQLLGVTPDLAVFGKAMSNGFPISAVCGRRDLMSRFRPEGDVLISGTYMGQLLGVTAALATLAALADGEVHARLFDYGRRMTTEITNTIASLELNAEFINFGSAWCLYFTKGVRSYRDIIHLVSHEGGDPRDRAFRTTMMNNGIFLLPVKTNKGYISGAHSREDIDKTIAVICEFLAEHRDDLR